MDREELLSEISRLDEEINATLSATKLPSLKKSVRFPMGTWIFAAALLAWSIFGGEIPALERPHLETETYAFYGAIVVAVLALLGTLRWVFTRGTNSFPPDYAASVSKVKALQEEREDLQAELRMQGR